MAEKKKTTENEEIKEQKNSSEKKENLKRDLEKELKEALELSNDYKDKWMRNVAEFDNYKKRNAKVYQDAFNDGAESVIVKILSIGDNLEWALSLGLDEKTADGIKNLKKKYDDTLTNLGVTEINPVGEKFDPNISEAIMQAEKEDGEESDTVKQVFQKGYKLKDKIIRYAKVSVIK